MEGTILVSGGCIVISDLNDTSNQSFLRGHDRPITCLDMSQSGNLAVSGQVSVHTFHLAPTSRLRLLGTRAWGAGGGLELSF